MQHTSNRTGALGGVSVAATVTEQVDAVIRGALDAGASDIHVEPVGGGQGAVAPSAGMPSAVRVRYRVDGVLREAARLPGTAAAGLAARIKVMASLDTAERRRPQDGRISYRVPPEARTGRAGTGGTRDVDLRVSTVPSTAGEKVVLRVLDRSALALDFDGLGLLASGATARGREALESALARPHGLVLVTGPTGSGKTTTLYAALEALDRDRLNVVSVEDPVEYDVEGVTQVAARPDLGLGFADALRAFLRQDPDVVLVGEIRDAETARIAVRAALTGHLVLSTLHTNDAPTAAARLADIGVEPYLLASALRLVVAQRLVRLLCPVCSEPAPHDSPEARAARELVGSSGEPEGSGDLEGERFRRAVGCEACGGTGYKGRTAAFEVVEADEGFRSLVARGAPASDLRDYARRAGAPSLRESASRLVREGRTTAAEVLRATDL